LPLIALLVRARVVLFAYLGFEHLVHGRLQGVAELVLATELPLHGLRIERNADRA
jgi:hypothetical protein